MLKKELFCLCFDVANTASNSYKKDCLRRGATFDMYFSCLRSRNTFPLHYYKQGMFKTYGLAQFICVTETFRQFEN